MSDAVLVDDACQCYNKFADCMREQGEVVPRWDNDVCDLSGNEVLAWMEFARRQNMVLYRLGQRIHALDQKLQSMEKQHHQRVTAALRTMETWGQRISARL